MCGIAGYVGKGNRELLKKMIAAIQYRGPDYQGFFAMGNVGFGHARLRILDLSDKSNQPMLNAARNVVLAFNGEIYNFQYLREKLEGLDKYHFTSSGDTEVILHLYEEYGEDCFSLLNGMFAIALYDFTEDKLLLVRDRLGKKPLYWADFGSTVVFASELKAITKHFLFSRRLNLEALDRYFFCEYVPTPLSIFENLYKLEPATILIWKKGKVRKKKFWKIADNEYAISPNEALSVLDKEIERSVKSRLVADVPLGIFLSGGIDSSTIAYYAQKNSKKNIKTFSVGFTEESFDESDYAKRVADFLGSEHYYMSIPSSQVLCFVSAALDAMDEPLADASFIPTLLLSRFTKQYVTVALGGDGADELFAGYETFQAQQLVYWYKKIPRVLRKGIVEKVISALPVSHDYFSLDFRLKKFIAGIDENPAYMHQKWLGSFSQEEREKLFTRQVQLELLDKNEFEEIDNYMQESANKSQENQLLYMYLRSYLMDGVMVKVDRASMRYALEVRSPFLDYKLVDFVSSLPYAMKCRGLETKHLLKKLMKNKLPKGIALRRKKGFGIPLAQWLRNELREFCRGALAEQKIRKTGLFNSQYINQLMVEHFEGKKNHRKKLWTLIVFMAWHEAYL